MSNGWLTIEEAAKRVGRSTRTIYAWSERKQLTIFDGGRVMEKQLLEADRVNRQRRGRPRREPHTETRYVPYKEGGTTVGIGAVVLTWRGDKLIRMEVVAIARDTP